MNALQEVKAVELELGDTLDITLPRLCELCSYFVCESRNRRINVLSKRKLTIGYHLQDHNADILFDDNGFILEGSTYFLN
jgi:hypothetical protein